MTGLLPLLLMKTLLPSVVLVTVCLSRSTTTAQPTKKINVVNEEIKKQIQTLEREERELYKNITSGIDDSLKALENMTGEDVKKGIEYLDFLKDYFKDIYKKENQTRRKIEQPGGLDLAYIYESLGKEKSQKELQKEQERLITKIEVQKKFEKWIKTKNFGKKGKGVEKCPGWGRSGKKGKFVTYPCCKRCCRLSVLGC